MDRREGQTVTQSLQGHKPQQGDDVGVRVLNCDVQGRVAGLVPDVVVGSVLQQQTNLTRAALSSCKMKRGVAGRIDGVDLGAVEKHEFG